MRVTRETQERTRKALLEAGRKLFEKRGFEPVTTREISRAARVAAGTLFNYFDSKEALAATLLDEAARRAETDASAHRRGDEELEELLFARIAAQLERFRPHRAWAGRVLEATQAFDPLARATHRSREIDALLACLSISGVDRAPSVVDLHLYWTLYVGVLAFWARDDSPHQEDTLALLDRSTQLFARVARETTSMQEKRRRARAR